MHSHIPRRKEFAYRLERESFRITESKMYTRKSDRERQEKKKEKADGKLDLRNFLTYSGGFKLKVDGSS